VNVHSKEVVAFFTDIIYRFGIPNTIITDNSTQSTRKKFLNFCDDNNIRVDWSAVAHPKMNGQVERANGMILQGLNPASSSASRSSGHDVWPSCRPFYGVCVPRHVGRPASHLSSWYTGRKPSYPWTSTTAVHKCEPTLRKAIK
jgi:hypothetical protein